MRIILAYIAFLLSGVAFATEPAKVATYQSETHFTAKSVIGSKVYNKDGQVGIIDDVLLDRRGALVGYIMKTGDVFLGVVATNPHRVVVPASAFEMEFDRWGDVRRLVLSMWKTDIKALPPFVMERKPSESK